MVKVGGGILPELVKRARWGGGEGWSWSANDGRREGGTLPGRLKGLAALG